MNEESNVQQVVPIKLAMTAVVVGLNLLVFFVFSERAASAEEPGIIPTLFLILGVVQSIVGIWYGIKARNGQPLTILSAACFEACALLAFITVSFIDTTTPLWLMPAVGAYAVVMIWIASPNEPMVIEASKIVK